MAWYVTVMPLKDPLERYVFVRASRAAMAHLRDLHPDVYAEAFEREKAVIAAEVALHGAPKHGRVGPPRTGRAPRKPRTLTEEELAQRETAREAKRERKRIAMAQTRAAAAAARAEQRASRPTPVKIAKPPKPIVAKPTPKPVVVRVPAPKPEMVYPPRPGPPVPPPPTHDEQGRPLCGRCKVGVSQWYACDCSPGLLDDDDNPLDPRYRSDTVGP